MRRTRRGGADFICPTEQTRAVFGDAFVIWLDRIDAGRFADTNRMFVAPEKYDLRVGAAGTPQYWAEQALGFCARRSIRNSRRRCSSAASSRSMAAISA